MLVAFGLVERRAAEPILPAAIFRRRLLTTTSLASLGVGAILIGLTSYVPLYVQGVLGTSALVAGFALAALTIGWPIAASTAGRLYLRIGFRNTALIGSAVIIGRRCPAGLLIRQLGLAGRADLLRHRARHGPDRQPDPDRRAVLGRLGGPRRGHRDQHVRPLDGQRDRDRRLRRHRQRPLGKRRRPRVSTAAGIPVGARPGPARGLPGHGASPCCSRWPCC